MRAESTPPENATTPSSLRRLTAVTIASSRVQGGGSGATRATSRLPQEMVPGATGPGMIPKASRAMQSSHVSRNSPPHRERAAGSSRSIRSTSSGESRTPSRSIQPFRFMVTRL
ncbi:hypothetical protein DSECCO2_563000 [anaerobic digester metagenome]